MIELAGLHAPVGHIRYTGVDLFEARTSSDGRGTTLKAAHRLLKATGARIQLIPGDPFTALSRAANTLGGTELVVISAGHDPDSLARAWFYLPRTLSAESLVLMERPCGPEGEPAFREIARNEVDRLAAAASVRRAA